MPPLRVITADLHVHTCLSPCATLDMTPRKIVAQARRMKLDMIAITDHNTAENTAALMAAAADVELTVIPGLEITTAEEAHVLGLFPTLDAALAMQELIYTHLTPGENDEDLFGLQVVASADDEVEAMCPRLLIGATDLDLERVVAAIGDLGGLAIAAHVDRESYSVVSQLGFIPSDLDLAALGISRQLTLAQARARFPEYREHTFLSTSDAHDLDQLGTNPTQLMMAAPDFAELRLALTGQDGRRVVEHA